MVMIGFPNPCTSIFQQFHWTAPKKQNDNQTFFGVPTKVWDDEFPVGSFFIFKDRKGDPAIQSSPRMINNIIFRAKCKEKRINQTFRAKRKETKMR